MAEWNWARFF